MLAGTLGSQMVIIKSWGFQLTTQASTDACSGMHSQELITFESLAQLFSAAACVCVTVTFWRMWGDENIIQMSGGLRYYKEVTGHRCMDGWMAGWMCWITVYRQARTTAYSHTIHTALQHTSAYQCYVKCCRFDCVFVIVSLSWLFLKQRAMLALISFADVVICCHLTVIYSKNKKRS